VKCASVLYTQVGDHRDTVTTVMPGITYDVRTPTAHPVYENFRTQMFHEVSCRQRATQPGPVTQAHACVKSKDIPWMHAGARGA